MKARVIKKLSKKLVESAPKLFRGAWVDSEIMVEAWEQGSSVSHVWSMGGGVDYWGEGEDTQTALQCIQSCWFWLGDFPCYEDGHKFEGYPNTGKFKPTGKNLLALARKAG